MGLYVRDIGLLKVRVSSEERCMSARAIEGAGSRF